MCTTTARPILKEIQQTNALFQGTSGAFILPAQADTGSDYINRLTLMHSIYVSAIATPVKILCMTHHVGLILVDEIQNAILTARKNRQIKPLIKFLVELTNDTRTATYFSGKHFSKSSSGDNTPVPWVSNSSSPAASMSYSPRILALSSDKMLFQVKTSFKAKTVF